MKTVNTKAAAGDFTALVATMETLARASQQMTTLEAEAQRIWLDAIGETLEADFGRLQGEIAAAEAEAEVLARRNPQWFEKQKSLKTPYGSVGFRTTSKLEVPNEELTLVLLDQEGMRDGFVRCSEALDLEKLEREDDDFLARIRVRRVTSESFSAKPAKIELGKAVKAAEEAGKKAKAAKN